MGDRGRPADRLALPGAQSASAIVDAQYWRALARARTSGPAGRAGAFAEARRLLAMAVALRRRETSPHVTRGRNPMPAARAHLVPTATPRGSYEHIRV